MAKVFLVEDEIIVREGLKKNIDWQGLGLEYVGEASDGELAYPMIQEAQPDILITDIKMPFMDGLQLSSLVKKEMPQVKIIIISGHDDFEYAQKAIAIGVTEYLLKPVNGAQISETVLRVKTSIESEQAQRAYLKRSEIEMAEYEKLERKTFFKELVGKRLAASEILEKGRGLGLELGATGYNIILMQLIQDADAYLESFVEVQSKLEESLATEAQMVLFERDLEGFAVLVKGSAAEPVEQTTGKCLDILRQICDNNGKTPYFVAVGTSVLRLNELPKVFDEVRRAFICRYIPGASKIIYASEVSKQQSFADGKFDLEDFDPSTVNKKIIGRFLRFASADEVAGFVDDYLNSIGVDRMESILFRQYVAMDAIFTVAVFAEETGADRRAFLSRFGNRSALADGLSDLNATRGYLISVISEALKLRDTSATQKYADVLEDARAFIEENYGSEDISLNLVAASVNISPSHFSTIFSQETGETFIEYLTRFRMEKAMELLRRTSMKASEIGHSVGYRDPHYFSYLFKKRLGVTPKEYRAGGRSMESGGGRL